MPAVAGIAEVVEGNGGLPKVRINSPAARGEMYLHGAHVTSWQPRGADEVLFVSAHSRWEDGRPIRGGIPICFPWFGNRAGDSRAPAHGFVRTKAWELQSIAQNQDSVTVSMVCDSNETTKKWWPAEFRLVHRVTFGAELTLELSLTNTGRATFTFEEALHAYFRVGSIHTARVRGLEAAQYIDKADGNLHKTQTGELAIVAETDRMYLNTDHPVDLEDPLLHRRICVTKENSLSTVIWNPWIQKAYALRDMGDDEWMRMVCIEAGNVAGSAVDLAPGRHHTMKAIISYKQA